jgi:uncharacterized protein (TIGR02118 family)
MTTLTAIYKAPENKQDFDTHYNDVHSPLVKQMEGIRKIELTRFKKMITPPTSAIAEQPHIMCVMHFDNKDALNAAMQSPGGMAAAKDLMGFAGPLVSMIIGETEEVSL